MPALSIDPDSTLSWIDSVSLSDQPLASGQWHQVDVEILPSKGCFDLCADLGEDGCNDANPCTDDACNPDDGSCINTPTEDPCDDGDVCTLQDTCSNGARDAWVRGCARSMAGLLPRQRPF